MDTICVKFKMYMQMKREVVDFFNQCKMNGPDEYGAEFYKLEHRTVDGTPVYVIKGSCPLMNYPQYQKIFGKFATIEAGWE